MPLRRWARTRPACCGDSATCDYSFSTVRMADLIAVLEGGRLTELSTHHKQLALDGTCARLFSMQAEGYR
jgi:hypothetical protein